ncbi:hypothetical protein [Streptomyces sp. NPDC006645]|uniref:hypothetical protein n=1 Tax=unclassified Streptomyces TaxID=2593676 RepID=UPI0033B549A2
MMQRKKIATTVAALAVITALGTATAGTATASTATAGTATAGTATAGTATAGTATAGTAGASDNQSARALAPAAVGPVKSWGPYISGPALKKAHVACIDFGRAGVKAKKWRSYVCLVESGKVKGDYVNLYVKKI